MTPSSHEAPLEAHLNFLTVSELLEGAPEAEWLVEGLVPKGALTLLHAPPKAGKSTLLVALLAALESGVPFCGLEVEQAKALLLTEEPPAALAEKVRRFGVSELLTLTRYNAHGKDWPAVVGCAVSEALSQGVAVLVVDTLAGWAGFEGEAENSTGAVSTALRPLRQAVERGLTVILIHHSNKSGTPGSKGIRGSSAILGEVDARVELRLVARRPSHRALASEGRFMHHLSSKLQVVLEGDGYRRHDLSEHAPVTASRSRGESCPTREREAQLLAAVQASGDAGLRLYAAREILRCRNEAVRKLVDDLIARELIVKRGEGGVGDPFRLVAPPCLTRPL